MEPTVEVRWIQRGRCPTAVEDWFRLALSPSSSMSPRHEERRDLYLYPADTPALGIKLRGPSNDKIEIKQRRQDIGLTTFHGGSVGRVEFWIRWSFNIDANNPGVGDPTRPGGVWVALTKSRDTRTFSVRSDGAVHEVADSGGLAGGCTAELTHLELAGRQWWTFALEAFGPLETARSHFDAIARHIFVERPGPYVFSAESSCSYPAWIGQHTGQGNALLD